MMEFHELELGKIVRLSSGDFLPAESVSQTGVFPVYGGNGVLGYTATNNFNKEEIVIGRVGALCGNVHVTPEKSWITDNALYVNKILIDIDKDFLFEILRGLNLNQYANKSGQPFISGSLIYPLTIKFPVTKSNQKLFAKQLSQKLSSVEQMRQASLKQKEAVEALQGALLREVFPYKEGEELPKGWKWEKIGNIIEDVKNQVQPNEELFKSLPFVGLENIVSHTREYTDEEYNPPSSTCFKFEETNILYGKLRPYLNKVFLPTSKGKSSMELIPLKTKNNYSREFLAAILQSEAVIGDTVKFSTGGRMPRADLAKLKKLEVAVPIDNKECNRIGKDVDEKINKLVSLKRKTATQLEAIEAMPAAILREVFDFKPHN